VYAVFLTKKSHETLFLDNLLLALLTFVIVYYIDLRCGIMIQFNSFQEASYKKIGFQE
jgi:hypothetical protein